MLAIETRAFGSGQFCSRRSSRKVRSYALAFGRLQFVFPGPLPQAKACFGTTESRPLSPVSFAINFFLSRLGTFVLPRVNIGLTVPH